MDYASCMGSLRYLGMTQINIIYAVNKLANTQEDQEKLTLKHSLISYDL
jgi:hypothetical protein